MTRKDMIFALTRYEIEWVFDNSEYFDEVVDFFASGGFNKYNNEILQKLYELKCVEVEA
jgi:hypothetical protein